MVLWCVTLDVAACGVSKPTASYRGKSPSGYTREMPSVNPIDWSAPGTPLMVNWQQASENQTAA